MRSEQRNEVSRAYSDCRLKNGCLAQSQSGRSEFDSEEHGDEYNHGDSKHSDKTNEEEESRTEGQFTSASDHAPSDGPDDLSSRLRALHLRVVNWTTDWGSEASWDQKFDDEVSIAEKEDGRRGITIFLGNCEHHVEEGRKILADTKFIAAGCGIHTGGEVLDLFFSRIRIGQSGS